MLTACEICEVGMMMKEKGRGLKEKEEEKGQSDCGEQA